MPLLAILRTISRYTRSLRYGDSLNSSQRYLIGTREGHLKTTKRPFHQHFGASKQIFNHSLKVNSAGNRIHGRVANVHVNKTKNMASELEGSGLNGSQKENDDISLPFWIFLWSFLAIVAGFIYSKLNRQKEIESELESCVKPDVNDEQIAKKFVKEIARKDSGKRTTFRRQRSYEIIDGEVRIHYDVSMLENSVYKSASVERLLETAEVESIPIQSASLEDLEFIYPGKLPSIVEEGDEDLEDQSEEQTPLTSINDRRPDAQTDFAETKGKQTKKTTTKTHISNSNESTCNVEGNGLHFEKKQNEFPTSFETITQETLIPAESINDANKITINPQKGNCVSFNHETELKEIKNETNSVEKLEEDESSSVSGDSVVENVSEMSDVTNCSHNSNTTATSVYKLSQVEKTEEHQFTVTRRKITKVKSSEEESLNSDSLSNETSFPFVKTEGKDKTGGRGDECSQLSRELQSDNFVSQQNMQPGLYLDDIEQLNCRTIVTREVKDFNPKAELLSVETCPKSSNACNNYTNTQFVKELSSVDVYECPKTVLDANEAIVKLSDEDDNECSASSSVPDRCSEGKPHILADNSGDILFKVIDPGTDNAYLEFERSGKLMTDENQNVDEFGGKNWNSLPSWEGVHSIKHRDLDSDSSDVGCFGFDANIMDDIEQNTSGVDPGLSLQDKNNELKQNLGNEDFVMQNGEVFNEDIREANILTFENKVGSRKTIFVKDVAETVNAESFDMPTDNTDIKEDEVVPTFGRLANENTSDVIIVAVQTQQVEGECPGQAASDEPVFATANVAKEHVLMAKIITDSEPSDVKIDLSKASSRSQTTTTIKTTQREMQTMKVHSIVKQFEEARKTNTSIQTINDHSDDDETTVLNKSHEQTDDDIERETVASYISQESELSDHDQISECPIALTSRDGNEETRPSDNADLVVDDSQISKLVLIPDFIVETKSDPSNEPCVNTDRTKLVESIPINVASMDKLESRPCKEEIKNDEDCVIYANPVTEVTVSDDENCETVEAISAGPVDDYSPIVVYASEISNPESTPGLHCKDDCGLDQRDKGNSPKGTIVIYANQDSSIEVASQPKPTNQSPTKITTEEEHISNEESPNTEHPKPLPPANETRDFRETSFDATLLISTPVMNTSSSEVQENDLRNVTLPSVSDPRTNNNSLDEIKEKQDKISSNASDNLVANQTPSEAQQNVLSSNILPSSTLHEVKNSPSELWQNLPRGETDVDNLSDIDEIDIDIPLDENYQKSKSVTDLDEALASFGSLDYLSNDALDPETGSLSKSVPDILDSCREESFRESAGNPVEKLHKKNLSLSTPEITSKAGSKKVTKIKIVHVKFLEMQSDSENVEEDSFIYDGDLPITGKMKRRSRNLSEELNSPEETPPSCSPTASPPPDLSREIAQERWVANKTHLKQLEFEFGDLFQNSPSPPPLKTNETRRNERETGGDAVQLNDLSYKTTDATPTESTQKPSLTHINKTSFESFNSSTVSRTSTSRFEAQSHTTKESPSSTVERSNATQPSSHVANESKFKPYFQRSSEDVIPASPVETTVASSTEKHFQTSNIIYSRTMLSSDRKTKVEYKNVQDNSLPTSLISRNERIPSNTSERITHSSTSTESSSYRYTPGNTRSYSKAPKPSPEQGKYVVKTAAQSSSKETRNITPQTRHTDSSPRSTGQLTEKLISARHITTQARYIDSQSASSFNSPQHGIKLTEKFRLSNGGNLPQKPSSDEQMPNETRRTWKSNQRGSSDKGTQRQSGRLVTVKSGMISDCSSDADSEMSYNVPSPRIKAKRCHRPQVHQVDSASSSEPDSPRRQINSKRRSMSELFGVDEGEQYSSDSSKEMGSQNSLRNQTLFARFGNVDKTRQNETFVESKSSPSYVYQARPTVFDPRPLHPDTREQGGRNPKPHHINPERDPVYQRSTATIFHSNPRNTNTLERNLSPTNFLYEGNLASDDHRSPKTMEFNPFEEMDSRDCFQPFERCHSPSSVYSDTSSVFSFNCDFDPMPAPTGKYEPEVYTCENPMCKKQDILLGPEKTSFKSCPACFTYYCSSECRKLHWPSHKQNCYFGRVNTYVRSIIRLCQRREDLSMYLSQLARDGYKKKGRGVVMAIFNSPDLAREFITKGHDAFSGRKPTYSSLPELHREGIISKHRVALMQAVRDYEPNQELVFNIAVVATNNIPIVPAPRYKLNTVLHCIKMPLNDLIVARQPKDYEKVETRLFALPKCSRHEFVNEMEARRHYCRNLSKNLRQYNVKLKEDYPECYRKLCMYVEHNISFEPMTVHGQRGGLSYKCVIAPEQSYPLNAEYC